MSTTIKGKKGKQFPINHSKIAMSTSRNNSTNSNWIETKKRHHSSSNSDPP